MHVIAQRFPAAAEPEDVTIDDATFERVTQEAVDSPGATLEIAEWATSVYDQLSASQRSLLPRLDGDISTVMQVLNVGRSRAYEAVGQLRSLLDRLLPDDGSRGAVAAAVAAMCGPR